MIGYVVIEKGELKVRENELYSGYYCGICKSLGSRHGQLPRFVLSYDTAFLAVVLDSLNSEPEKVKKERCMTHYINKRTVVRENNAIDYSADVMIILAYFNMLDNVLDDKDLKSKIAEKLFRKHYKKLYKNYKNLCDNIEKEIYNLSIEEKNKTHNLDIVAEKFAIIMENVFASYPKCDHKQKRVLGEIGKHLGKWIYLIDALDDLEEDIAEDKYNPFIYRFVYNIEEESLKEFCNRVREQMKAPLFMHLAQIADTIELLPIKKNKGIIDNIILMGMRRKTELVLTKGNETNE